MSEHCKEYIRLAAELERMTEEQRESDEVERTHYSVMDRLWLAMSMEEVKSVGECMALRMAGQMAEVQP